ncbi:hypothetical protein BDY17DRAFT_49987 [Neohortaea acidophila]|uniref:Uncharacterized protein n=1 Tax=Neohortaea acidophila TaxID=245834 RepID=A0A6A6PIN0_9PEZI|nr:uncharacterized protein BDY17DRAFT_49987 [Neohortaea acidophila]KAF2479127.1 hypothetical protein BDY17DRAFT_49987 [Neohortaea acidophila]
MSVVEGSCRHARGRARKRGQQSRNAGTSPRARNNIRHAKDRFSWLQLPFNIFVRSRESMVALCSGVRPRLSRVRADESKQERNIQKLLAASSHTSTTLNMHRLIRPGASFLFIIFVKSNERCGHCEAACAYEVVRSNVAAHPSKALHARQKAKKKRQSTVRTHLKPRLPILAKRSICSRERR